MNSMRNFIPYVVLKVVRIVPCANRIFRLLQNHFFWFWMLLIVSYYISAIAAVVASEKSAVASEMNCKSSIRLSHPISEITTSYVCRLKRPETRVIKNQMFFKSRKWVYIGCKTVDSLQWGKRSWNMPKVGPAHPHFMLWSIFENIMFWLIEID